MECAFCSVGGRARQAGSSHTADGRAMQQEKSSEASQQRRMNEGCSGE